MQAFFAVYSVFFMTPQASIHAACRNSCAARRNSFGAPGSLPPTALHRQIARVPSPPARVMNCPCGACLHLITACGGASPQGEASFFAFSSRRRCRSVSKADEVEWIAFGMNCGSGAPGTLHSADASLHRQIARVPSSPARVMNCPSDMNCLRHELAAP